MYSRSRYVKRDEANTTKGRILNICSVLGLTASYKRTVRSLLVLSSKCRFWSGGSSQCNRCFNSNVPQSPLACCLTEVGKSWTASCVTLVSQVPSRFGALQCELERSGIDSKLLAIVEGKRSLNRRLCVLLIEIIFLFPFRGLGGVELETFPLAKRCQAKRLLRIRTRCYPHIFS